jgi:uncharacterized protein (DUF2336 family)
MAMSLAYLQMLARERRPSHRHELLRALTDIFLEAPQPLSARECELFDEVVDSILDDVEPLARQELAERLAPRRDAPRRVVVRLAGDAIAVAAPLLVHSQVLEDDDLAALAAEKSQDHLLAIARRPCLSEGITDILIERGDVLVLHAVAENLGAQCSASGFRALVDKARTREPLWRRIAGRRDLPVAGERLRPPADVQARPLDELTELIVQGSLLFGEAVIELADAGRVTDLGMLVSGRLGVDFLAFARDLFAPNEMPLMRRCAQAGLDLESFSAVLRLRRRRHRFSAGAISEMLRSYQALCRER